MNLDPNKVPLIPLQPQLDFFSANKNVWAGDLVNATNDHDRRQALKAIINANLIINSPRRRMTYLEYQKSKQESEQNVPTDI